MSEVANEIVKETRLQYNAVQQVVLDFFKQLKQNPEMAQAKSKGVQMKKISARDIIQRADNDSMGVGAGGDEGGSETFEKKEINSTIFTPSEKAVLKKNGFRDYDPTNTEYSFFGKTIKVIVPQLSQQSLYKILESNSQHVDYRGDKTKIPNRLVEIKTTLEKEDNLVKIEAFISFDGMNWKDNAFERSEWEEYGIISEKLVGGSALEVIKKANAVIAAAKKLVMKDALKMQKIVVENIAEEAGVGRGSEEISDFADSIDDDFDE